MGVQKSGFCEFKVSQIATFIGPTWGPPRSCQPQMGHLLAPWTLLSGMISVLSQSLLCCIRYYVDLDCVITTPYCIPHIQGNYKCTYFIRCQMIMFPYNDSYHLFWLSWLICTSNSHYTWHILLNGYTTALLYYVNGIQTSYYIQEWAWLYTNSSYKTRLLFC